MQFCEKCGSYMKRTKDGFMCRKCGNRIQVSARMETMDAKKNEPARIIHVVDQSEDEYVKVSQVCPICGNGEAFRWFSRVSGDHAGIRSERTVEHFRCTKCSHSWSKAS